jgi:AcrR family transcriptional regulator
MRKLLVVPAPRALPLAQLPRAERVDAARNREAILCAARRLVAEQGPEAITMDRLAAAAGVGKGTLFRHFGDRAGLFHALLDESERRLQEGFIRGPAPLGPGAPERDRIVAFGRALLELTADRGELLLAATPPNGGPRYASPVFQAYWGHLLVLLEPLVGAARATYLADVLLGALAPELVVYQLRRGMTLDELQERFTELSAGLLGVD